MPRPVIYLIIIIHCIGLRPVNIVGVCNLHWSQMRDDAQPGTADMRSHVGPAGILVSVQSAANSIEVSDISFLQ
jgi:hypothetical protein